MEGVVKMGMFHVKQFEKLAAFCKENNLDYNDNKAKQFAVFCDYLIEKNKVMNLTAVIDPVEIEIKHFIDSLEGAAVIKELFSTETAVKIIDMGSGAGFPGIPLAIMLPEYSFSMADSLNKRVVFLNDVIRLIKLENSKAIQGRAEEIGQSELRETFDICISRAVAEMPVLLEYCLPMIRIGGYAILYKSGEYKEEIRSAKAALDLLGGKIHMIKEFSLPDTDISRSLIIVYKEKATPIKYPRRPGKPSKTPIK